MNETKAGVHRVECEVSARRSAANCLSVAGPEKINDHECRISVWPDWLSNEGSSVPASAWLTH